MAIWDRFSKKTATPVAQYTPTFIPIDWMNNFLSGFSDLSDKTALKYYYCVPELAAIINYRAKCLSSMKVKLKDIRTDNIIEKHPVLDRMKQPNVLLSFQEWVKQYSINRDLFGNTYLYNLFGTNPMQSKGLFWMPSADTKVELKKPYSMFPESLDEFIKEYVFTLEQKEYKFTPDEITHFYDYLMPGKGKGDSKITALQSNLETIKTTYEARGVIIGNSPVGIFSSGATGDSLQQMTPIEKKDVQDEMKKYGLKLNKYQFIITTANLKFTPVSINLDQLKFYQGLEHDQSAIADAYSFPVELFQNGVTYENKKEAKKQLYQDSIIPEATDWLEGLSSGLGLIDNNLMLVPDFSHIAALQTDYETKSRTWNFAVTAYSKAKADGVISDEEYKDGLSNIGMI